MTLWQNQTESRYGIVLSAGNGKRLRDFIYQTRGHYLPKQYVNLIGNRSMLEHTFHRTEKLIPAQKLLVVIAKEHLRFDEVSCQIASRPRGCVVIQPENRDTGPGLLLPLLYLYKQHPEAAVAVFPSDHFILEEDLFMQQVDCAFRVVESDGSSIILLGIQPHEPDPEYGYIVPGEQIDGPGLHSIRKVALFVEKPAAEAAKKIIASGALWNTLVIVGMCETLVDIIRQTTPELYRPFEPILASLGTAEERRTIEQVYHELPSLNFSKGVLQVLPFEYRRALGVLPVRDVTWSDWGTATRLLDTLKHLHKTTDSAHKFSVRGREDIFRRRRPQFSRD